MRALGDRAQWVWQDLAACRDEPLWRFFGRPGESKDQQRNREEAAARVCEGCSVIAECLDRALTKPERYGVWGGTTPAERVQIKNRLAKARRRARADRPISVKPGHMPAVGDMRILQGLAASHGYDVEEVRSWVRLPVTVLYQVRAGRRRTWAASSSAKLRAAISQILSVPASRPGPERAFAMAQGWARLEAWDWDALDDPNARPARLGYRSGGVHAGSDW